LKGLELSERYYYEYGAEMIRNSFFSVEGKLAIGLVGSGSECFGYDDEVSQDHDFEPGFCIFIPDTGEVDEQTAFALSRAYAKLPEEFMGFKRLKVSPVGGSRHGVIRINDFYISKCGQPDGKLMTPDWLHVPEYSLAEAVNGKVFVDNYGEFTAIRESLSYFPEYIRQKKLAGYLLQMAQSGQYNYMRSIKRGENAAAQLALHTFTDAALHVIFLLNKKYMPYYKWCFRSLKELERLSGLYESLEYLISSDNDGGKAVTKAGMTEDIAALIIRELKADGLTDATCNELEKHAYSVNDHIKDGMIRNMDIFEGI
jgi:hypothetical protein